MRTDLTARQVAALRAPGRHRVSDNLFLYLKPPRKAWVHVFVCPVSGVPHEMGLGPYGLNPLPQLKATVLRYRALEREGRCPLCERRGQQQARRAPSFGEVVDAYIRAHQASWRSAEHKRQWGDLRRQAAALWSLPVNAIDTGAVIQTLERGWQEKPATFSRVRARIEAALDFATARGWRAGDNPARWRGHLENLLPAKNKLRPVKHHAALPWSEAPAFWSRLDARSGVPTLALKLIVLTACRRGEVLTARWSEIERDGNGNGPVWTVPGEKMKSGREHRVPLSAPALAVLDALAELRQGEWLFPSSVDGRPLSPPPVIALMQQLAPNATIHGFRSSFRDWCAEATTTRTDIAEAVLAHTIRDRTVAAYQRGDLLSLRAGLMADWARYLTSGGEG
jgi:integrase